MSVAATASAGAGLPGSAGCGRMKISELLKPSLIKTDLQSEDKEHLFEEMIQLFCNEGMLTDPEAALGALHEREDKMSTGIANGLALPHGKIGEKRGLLIAIGISRQGIAYESLDGAPIHVVIMVLAEIGNPGPHIKALAEISRLCALPGLLDGLRAARTPAEILDLIRQGE